MKQTLLIVGTLCVLAMNHIQAQTTPSASEQLPAFSTVIPKLELLKSGYPDVKEAGKEEVVLTKDGKHFKLIGKKITSKDISDKLKLYLVDAKTTNMWKDNPRDGIKQLSIYCETLVLQADIWLPETNIDIQAKEITMHGYSIRTEPLPWRNAVQFDSLSATETRAGKAGGKAGDIRVVSESLVIGSNQTPFLANGGQGEAVFVPEMDIIKPYTQLEGENAIEVYQNHECTESDGGKKTGRSKRWTTTRDDIVAATFSNTEDFVFSAAKTCYGQKIPILNPTIQLHPYVH
jgi:hypothetical protein